MTALINLKNLTFTYPNRKNPAIKNVSLLIERGEHIAIIGANGSGKSTLARHFNALLVAQEGEVFINGKTYKDSSKLKEIRRTIGMVFQNPENQIIGATVEEDIAFGLENLAVPTNEIINKVDKILDVVGMRDYRRRPAHMLSGGQIQKLCLASVLVMNPACVIFDEATAMLDPRSRNRIYEAMDSLRNDGITVITITHDMEEAAMADRLLVMHEGELIADSTPRELFSNKPDLATYNLDIPPITEIANQVFESIGEMKQTLLTIDEFSAILPRKKHMIPFVSPKSRNNTYFKKPIISIKNLSYAYLPESKIEKNVLKNTNMKVLENSIHGLLGATGVGKTTLMQHINGLILPQSGKVKIKEEYTNDKTINLKQLRQTVGFVFQYPSHQLFENYVGDEIAFGLRALGINSGLKNRVKEAMLLVGMDFNEFVDRQTFTLSGGEKKKVALASILVMNPEILLFDEPTVGLDPTSQKNLMNMLTGYQKKNGKTILFSSHNTNLIAEYTQFATAIGKDQEAFSAAIDKFFGYDGLIENYDLNYPTSILASKLLRKRGWDIPTTITKKTDIMDAIKKRSKNE